MLSHLVGSDSMQWRKEALLWMRWWRATKHQGKWDRKFANETSRNDPESENGEREAVGRRCRELHGLILIQTGKITGGWIESGPLQLPPQAVPVKFFSSSHSCFLAYANTHLRTHCHVLLTVPLLSVSLLEHNVFL